MGILYEQMDAMGWAFFLAVLFGLMAFNELARSNKYFGLLLFLVMPLILTIFVWPTTAAPGNEYGTGNWFNWVKTYSALAGCLGFMAICYIPKLQKSRFAIYFPPIIIAVNILEAVFRDFQCFSYGAFDGAYVDNLWVISGPWNIMNGIAGILNIITICGWAGIYVSNGKRRDMMWPDMIWPWIIAYDLWNFAYTYNCIADHSIYCGMALLLSCTIPAFVIKRGMWLQHRAHTLAFWIMFVMTVPTFADQIAPVSTTHNPTAFFVVSALSLAFNLGLAIYQFRKIRNKGLHPLKDELYTETRAYQQVIEDYPALSE
ncbi:MAG: hypothetical protein IJ443_04800 [Firmicutes bacterium]|nr:hypothetical protein [Bacillota bacterium]